LANGTGKNPIVDPKAGQPFPMNVVFGRQAALKSARLAVPSTPSDARLELAELIVALAKKTTSTEARATLATEALAFADETLAAHPNDGLGPRVASIKEEGGRLQGKEGR
jgi:hypothetical protein